MQPGRFVFVNDNLLNSPITNLRDEVRYDIATTTPMGMTVPVTYFWYMPEPIPLISYRRGAHRGRMLIAKIHWKGVVTKTTIHVRDDREMMLDGVGVNAKKVLRKKNPLSLSRKCQYFTGNNGVKYRWKVIGSIGCLLTLKRVEIARCLKRFVPDGMFIGQDKFVWDIKPECKTLDAGLMLLTFSIVDNKRQMKAYGPARLAAQEDHDPEGEGEESGVHGMEA